MPEGARDLLELLPYVIEIVSAGALSVGFVLVTVLWLFNRGKEGPRAALEWYRQALGRVILVGLELLVAASIIKTVVFEPTLDGVGRLAVLVAIRTFIGWTTVLELSGKWPWQRSPAHSTASD